MSRRIIINEHRDIPLFIHIWKWKVATTASIYHKFFANRSAFTAYSRLNRLKKNGFLQIRTDIGGREPVWMLDKKGFLSIKDLLPDLKEDGFRSENIQHDLWCSAVHLGNFLINEPENIQLITEQQLRRYRGEDLPVWVPSAELHRPDGYWRIGNGNSSLTVALELERSRKSTPKIEKLATFYANFNSNFRVLWVLEGKGLMKRLIFNLKKASHGEDIHNIVLLKDFLNNGWQSKIIHGPETNLSIEEFIYSKAIKKSEKSPKTFYSQIILDSRLYYRNNSLNSKSINSLKTATV